MLGRIAGVTLVALVALAGTGRAQQKVEPLPPGVTPQMIKDGQGIFQGAGLCTACHGPDAKGIPNLGANLTDTEWLHSKGTYDDIVKQVMTGVTADKSTSGTVMPPKGGSSITDAQVKAVAAYVWSLSHKTK